MPETTRNSTCRNCGGTGSIALLTSVVPCECRLDTEINQALADAGLPPLSLRTWKILRTQGIHTLRQLLQTRPGDLVGVRFFRPSTRTELERVVRQLVNRPWA